MIRISHQKLFRRSEFYGFLAALGIHIVVANLFVLTVPVRSVAHKPVFVYLGSFLENIQSIEQFYPSQKRSSIPGDGTSIPVLRKTSNKSPLPGNPSSVSQHEATFQPRQTFTSKKTTLKETFLQENELPLKTLDKKNLKKIQVNPDLAPYKPLSLQARP